MPELPALVRAAIDDYSMLSSGKKVYVALSGGADSVALLLCLSEICGSVSAIHVNHSLRGEESDSDEQFCRSLCQGLAIPFESRRVDAAGFSAAEGLSTEEGARVLRYRVFAEIAHDGIIATAHTMSDNAETMLINMTRGSGLKGLCGIPPVRGNIIRPLIYASRRDVVDYLSEKSQDFVTDSTNLSDKYTRNKIRHAVIPVLRQINPSLEKTMRGTRSALEADELYLEEEAGRAFDKCILPTGDGFSAELSEYHGALRIRCISTLLRSREIPVSFERLAAADELLLYGGCMSLSADAVLSSENGVLRIKQLSASAENEDFRIPLDYGKTICVGNKTIRTTITHIEIADVDSIIHTNLAYCTLDYDKIKGQVFIRNRRAGDRLTLCGRQHSSLVKKLLNASVPAPERGNLLFLEDSDGLIFIEKIGVARRAGVNAATRKILTVYTDSGAEK